MYGASLYTMSDDGRGSVNIKICEPSKLPKIGEKIGARLMEAESPAPRSDKVSSFAVFLVNSESMT